jgi:regulator of protease activity HflC (stomatin/prohibitin superfamily)
MSQKPEIRHGPDKSPETRSLTMKSTSTFLIVAGVLGLAVFALTQVPLRPYDTPEYVEIDTSESAFLIPLEGDTTNQATFQSVKFLEEKKVAAKRIQITHRWNQTGYWSINGHWLPAVKLIKVDRRPITREWTKSAKSGTSPKDEAIHAETKDSINFSTGISCTAYIPEDLAAVFLYSYPSKSLADMMDMEVRARIQQLVAEEAGKFELDKLRYNKSEVMKAVKEDVVPFFRKKGIEITTIAMVGGFHYENPEIQRAIDDAAKASQLKVAAEAEREAQEVKNKTLKLSAEGRILAAKLEAQGKAEAEIAKAEADAKVRRLTAEAEAEYIRKVADAKAYEVSKAKESPEVYFQLKWIETELQKLKAWDGKYPSYLMQVGSGGAGSPGFFLQPPVMPDPWKKLPVSTTEQAAKK